MSEDVTRFLSQVKELGERRLEEDEARSRELEEKILQDRKERQARRRERARSISPQKSSPMNTPPPPSQSTSSLRPERLDLASPPVLHPTSSPQSQPLPKPGTEGDDMSTAIPISTSLSKENDSPSDGDIKPSQPPSPTRNGTVRGLSWQRRPNSQASERSRNRPLSMFAAENATRSSSFTAEQETTADNPTRDQIASALSTKDPSWFRQTADRGASSAAYRRNQVEDTQTVDLSSAQTQLPGMSRSIPGESFRNGQAALLESPALRSTVTSASLSDAPKLDPPPLDTIQTDVDSAREVRGPFSPSLGRISPTKTERPVSPTKGTGGFVQSAMMKRSESVSKRWSVQSPAGLHRADTMASNRNGYDPTNRMGTSTKIRPTTVFRETSIESATPSMSEAKEENQPSSATSASVPLDTPTSPEPQSQDSSHVTPPVSPSKTMDSRRWSPQKSSWLESALNKPESPKPKSAPAPPSQPAWMAELQKAKAQKASNPGSEGSKAPVTSHRHQVSIGGLMRSSAPGVNTTPVGRGSLHHPSPSLSSINSPVTSAKPSEPQPPVVAAKSMPEPVIDTKQATLPSANKVKPATPPKKDFRASLKPRATTITAPPGTEAVEFKNVFGNLRKATTQNYVAEDELKNNITRGKAALTVTGGPQKSERVDEFKEAIIAKKKEFQASNPGGRPLPRNGSVSHENPIPEGLLKRAELGRSNTIKRGSVSSDVPGTDSRLPKAVPQQDSIAANFAGRFERFSNLEKRTSAIETPISKAEGQETPTTPSHTRKPSIPKPTIGPSDRTSENNGPVRVPGKIAGSALANRFNPALAGFLSRGPPTASSPGSSTGGTIAPDSKADTDNNETGPGPSLTHMTKNRARGPKRKAPTRSSDPSKATIESKPIAPKRTWANTSAVGDHVAPSPPTELMTLVVSSKIEQVIPVQPRPKPITLTSASRLATQPTTASFEAATERPKLTNKVHGQIAAIVTQGEQTAASKFTDEPQEISPRSPSPGKLNMNRMSRFMDTAPTTDKRQSTEQYTPSETPIQTKSALGKTSNQDVPQKPQSRSSSLNKPKIPLPIKQGSPKPEVTGGETTVEAKVTAPIGARPLPTPPVVAASQSSNVSVRPLSKEPERNPGSSAPLEPNSSAALASSAQSPTKPLDTSDMLRDFFGSGRPQRNYRVDTAELLMQRPSTVPLRIRTLSSQLFQYSVDGKKQPVPVHNERTLFECDMYLCTHSFSNGAGRQMIEVYFWAGSEVPKSSVESAAVSAAREAHSLGGALVKLQQGKETPEFLQALGGIVITQRGSGSKYDSLAPHMICGRRYYGHIVLDEVDFTSSALCSGFPYIISQGGRCYLWKGKGSSVDELSCARLIGMDYALSGELEEVEEGREPAAFWDLFDGANRFGSADHWRLKPNYEKYCSRLFLSDAVSRQQIVELPTFAQTDLLPTNIYIIDAFFELYIVVGSQAQAEYASFHNALEFAQEYAILAASMEDRPFVPVSTVVLEGIPRDMKSVFRKWQDAFSPTITNANVGLKRGRSLKIVSLSQALQALGD